MNNLSFSTGKRKVAIVGVGYVGASIAYALTVRSIAREIVLIDRDASIGAGRGARHSPRRSLYGYLAGICRRLCRLRRL